MSRLLVNQYLAEIDRLRAVSGSSIGSIVSEAFKDLLKEWSGRQGLIFLAQPILPYYVANLNIEATYAAVTAQSLLEIRPTTPMSMVSNKCHCGRLRRT